MASKILVVDDSVVVRQQLRRALEGTHFDVVEAEDGLDALEKLSACDEVVLVVSDINMPRMNGIELLDAMRQDLRWKTLAVVMLTTEGQPELVQRAKALGAKGWIVKPFKAHLLTAAIMKLVSAAATQKNARTAA
jgi:two-component system, chemotaxis family, chemotaxis protein CheY